MGKYKQGLNNTEILSFVAETGHQFKDTARVGNCDNYEVFISGNEANIPHLHIYNESESFYCCVRLDKADYFFHDKNTNTLSKYLKKKFTDFMNKKVNKGFSIYITNWVYSVILWNDNNPMYKMKADISIPDYMTLG
jgi:hypothetical protein